ncbi:hypothetical protein C8J55DRAFT_494537 [Lentinula edodes]|uniref:WD40 repeat-like protein n=1 Tax=Lentinula lateritia TaxID=40482 RepID=A0A9W9E0Y0_9AGAR|nr:hypothetical protein C8J55DRAFT_494537 [Lentinula edodes]
MWRTLRARKSLPNYASIVGIEDDANEAGPSTLPLDDSSRSAFTPEKETTSRKSQVVDLDEGGELSDEELPEALATAPSRVKSKGRVRKGKGPISVVKSTIPKPATLSGNFRRQDVYLTDTKRSPSTSSSSSVFCSRTRGMIGLATKLVFSLGSCSNQQLCNECHNHRPIEQGLGIRYREGSTYLPTDDIITKEDNFRPPPPIPCYFGPFGSQTARTTEMLSAFKMADFFPNSSAHVFNAGAPVWGIDWCPLHPETRKENGYRYYLAVGPLPSPSHSPEIGIRVQRRSKACIQIWSFGSDAGYESASTGRKGNTNGASEPDSGRMRCDSVICIDCGPAYELKWSQTAFAGPRNGSFAIFAIPDPKDIAPSNHDYSEPLYTVLRIEMEEACCWSIDWANSEVVAIGMTNGSLPITNLLPTQYLNIHQAAIRTLAWIRPPTNDRLREPRYDEDPMILGSGGNDGVVCLTKIRSGHGSVMDRTRDVINSMSYSPYGGGLVTIDHDDAVKAYSASPKMLGRSRGHMLVEPQGPVWTISASDLHPQLAVGAADDISTRRGGSVPFFAHKIYQLDCNRTTQEFRMLEQFLPQETQDRGAANNPNNVKLKNAANDERGTGVWPRELGVQRVVWNIVNGLAAATMLASATGSGLCRVDVLFGRWLKERSVKMPYGGIENIRLEAENVVDDIDADSDEGSTR